MLKEIVLFLTITTYNPCPEQGWGDGLITADGSRVTNPNAGWVAISPDLFDKGLRYGDAIVIDGKTYIVKDKTNKRLKNTVDIMQSFDRKNFKKQSEVKLYLDIKEYERRTGKRSESSRYEWCGNAERTFFGRSDSGNI